MDRLRFNKHLLEVQYTYTYHLFECHSPCPNNDHHLISAYNDMLAILIFNLTHCRFLINVELCNTTFVMVQMYSRVEYRAL